MELQLQHDRRWCERASVEGVAAVLEFGYLGVVYVVTDISLGGARLLGPSRLPGISFDILLCVSGRYLERRARRVWDDRITTDSFGIEFESPGALELAPLPLSIQH